MTGHFVSVPFNCDVPEILQQLPPKCCANALGVELHSIVGQACVCYALKDSVSCMSVLI